jgi:transcriptional regulator with XRE-family HTH domain
LSTKPDIRLMEDIKIRFGRRLRELRLEKGWSQETLANLADIDRTYIPGIESGKRNVSIVILEKLSRSFEINISDLLGEIDKE